MTKPEAKRLACFHVALLIETALGGGWDVGETADDAEVETDADLDRLMAGLDEIQEEMHNRGSKR